MPIKNKIVCNKSNINVMQNWKLKTSLKQAKQGLMDKNCFTTAKSYLRKNMFKGHKTIVFYYPNNKFQIKPLFIQF